MALIPENERVQFWNVIPSIMINIPNIQSAEHRAESRGNPPALLASKSASVRRLQSLVHLYNRVLDRIQTGIARRNDSLDEIGYTTSPAAPLRHGELHKLSDESSGPWSFVDLPLSGPRVRVYCRPCSTSPYPLGSTRARVGDAVSGEYQEHSFHARGGSFSRLCLAVARAAADSNHLISAPSFPSFQVSGKSHEASRPVSCGGKSLHRSKTRVCVGV